MDVRPLGAMILCKAIEVDNHYPGGVIELLPDRIEETVRRQAEIVAVGPGGRDEDGDLIPMDPDLQPGTWIIHNREFGKTEAPDGQFWITQDDVVAIIS